MSKANIETLADIHNAIAQALLKKIKSGKATASDLNVARQFLRDNNINAIRTPDNGLDTLARELPFASPETIDDDPDLIH
jgi:hypothetical protein